LQAALTSNSSSSSSSISSSKVAKQQRSAIALSAATLIDEPPGVIVLIRGFDPLQQRSVSKAAADPYKTCAEIMSCGIRQAPIPAPFNEHERLITSGELASHDTEQRSSADLAMLRRFY
jgi:hypothetical protein